MSEGLYTVLSSDRPSSCKRPRAGDLDSEGWPRRSNCLWQGCRRLENGRGDYHPFCSSAHRDYHYADLFDMFKDRRAPAIEQSIVSTCKYYGCNSPVWVDSSTGEAYDFCRRWHSLMYKERTAKKWYLERRLCKLNDCDNHIAVESSGKIHEHCCRGHLYSEAGERGKLAAKRRLSAAENAAKTDGGEGPSRRDELLQRSISQEAPQMDLEVQIMGAIKNCLKHLLDNPGDFNGADPNGLFRSVPNVTDFHPWDEVIESEGFRPRYYVHYIDSARVKNRSTKEGFRWKQTGSATTRNDNKVIKRQFFYELKEKEFKKDKRRGELQSGEKNRWRLYEYSHIATKSPKEVPVISKIFQAKVRLPVLTILGKRGSQAKKVSNEDYKHVRERIISSAISLTEGQVVSSHSSNTSTSLEVGTIEGAPSHSNIHEKSINFSFPLNISTEMFANENNDLVLGEEISHFGEGGTSWNTSTPWWSAFMG